MKPKNILRLVMVITIFISLSVTALAPNNKHIVESLGIDVEVVVFDSWDYIKIALSLDEKYNTSYKYYFSRGIYYYTGDGQNIIILHEDRYDDCTVNHEYGHILERLEGLEYHSKYASKCGEGNRPY